MALELLHDDLTQWDEAIASGEAKDKAYALDMIEDRLERLAKLGSGAADAVPKLAELTHHADPHVRRLAIAVLKQIDIK